METSEEEYTSFSFKRIHNSHKYCFVNNVSSLTENELSFNLLIKKIP